RLICCAAMHPSAASRLLSTLVSCFAVAPFLCAQGPLTPPGSPAPSMKSLDQIDARVATAGERIPINATTCPGNAGSVFIIASSGSYFLTGDVSGSSGQNGITVNAANVTLNLNGYSVLGGGGSVAGVSINYQNVTVRNGRVIGWGGNGVEVNSSEGA